jgi:hypothetical protein
MTDHGGSLMLEFANDSRDFALGFELGRVWSVLNTTDDPYDCEMHAENAEMMLRIGDATGRTVRWEEHNPTWATVYFSERHTPKS